MLNLHSNCVEDQIKDWKQDKISAPNKEALEMNPSVFRKAKMIRIGLIVADIVGYIFFILASASLAMNLFILEISIIMVVAGGRLCSDIVGIAIYCGLGIVCGSCAAASHIGMLILNRSETLREERALKDINFKEFVEEYVEKQAHFIPTKEALKDRKLHDIYVQWEASMKKFDI